MPSWSKRRKIMYGGAVAIFLIGVIGIPTFRYFYQAPTCSDGKKNGDEKGIDCGGSCQRLCQSDFLAPDVAWTRFEELAPGLYNLATYIINPNTSGEAKDVPYQMSVYDSKGASIIETRSIVTLPPHRNTLAFQSAVSVGKRTPARVLFEFTSPPDWYRSSDTLSAISVVDKKYSEDETGSSLSVALKNSSPYAIGRISVYAILYDKDGNSLGFSKTILDEIPALGSVTAPFTWSVNRQGKVISIEVLPVAE